MAIESPGMFTIVKLTRPFQYFALGVSALVAGCDSLSGCCQENWTVSHALIYGVVRYPDGRAAVGASVHSTAVGSDTVTTKSGGEYRLRLSFPLMGPGIQQSSINVFPPSYSPADDSIAKVSFSVQLFASEPVGDSTRVDITLIQ